MLKNIVKRNSYFDSVTLMLITKQLCGIDEISNASVMMGSNYNKELMEASGLLDEEGAKAGPNDLIIAIESVGSNGINKSLDLIERLLSKRPQDIPGNQLPRSVVAAVDMNDGCNMAVISVPGQYAALEAKKALDQGLDIFLFSDNVSIEEEAFLKHYAKEKNLLVMGPDCGTSVINGVGIGFANSLKRGNVGIVSASGTGLQEVASLLNSKGMGISHAIGTGGRDLSEKIRGISMTKGLYMLEANKDTQLIIVISKPPHPEAVDEISNVLEQVKKPVVICFLDGNSKRDDEKKRYYAANLEEVTFMAAQLLGTADEEKIDIDILRQLAKSEAEKMNSQQKYVRALYTGGTLCYEAMLIGREYLPDIYSNIHLEGIHSLKNPDEYSGDTYLDLGDDFFTCGRPHPMIDPENRVMRVREEAKNSDVAVILLDFVLGYGGHHDPAGLIAEVIKQEKQIALDEARHLTVVASVCGTELDSPSRSEQVKKLVDAGVMVLPSNARAAFLAALIGSYTQGGGDTNE